MHLIQIFFSVFNPQKLLFPSHFYKKLSKNLTEKLGGLTSYFRSPAEGLWKEDGNKTVKDDIIIYEIVVETVDIAWWIN